MSATPDSTLADSERLIADLQRQLAERTAERDEASRRLDVRTAERDEALQREIAAAEVLGVINSSPGDLAPVFDAMLEKAMRLCGGAFGLMIVSDGDEAPILAARGVPAAFAEFRRKHPVSLVKGPFFSRLLAGEDFIHTIDLKDDDAYRRGDPLRHAIVDLGGGRTSLIVPLRRDREVLGTIHIYRQEVRPFTDKQIAVVQNFAAQAVIAMENARLLTETREALEQQTATAEVLQIINSSPGDLAPVFDAMLEKALDLCRAGFGVLWTYDGERMNATAIRGATPAYTEFLTSAPHRPETGIAHRGLIAGADLVHVADVADSDDYRAGDPLPRAFVDLGGGRSLLAVPLRKDGAFLGVIAIYRREAGPFSDKQIALLQNFAAQAVIAMENARLITETREALEQQTATAEVLGVINSSPGDLGPVFDAMLGKATRLCEAQTGHLFRFENGAFCRAASLGIPEEFDRLLPLNTPMPDAMTRDSVVTRLLTTRAPVHVHDLREDESYRVRAPAEVAAVEEAGIRTGLIVPMLREADVVGAFLMHRREVRPFTDKQIALLENFAAQAVIAMENARLLTETREALEQQTATAEVLQVINSSPGDLAPVFDAILEKAHTLCGIWRGSLQLYDGDRFCAVATRGVSEAQDTLLRQPHPPGSGGARLLAGDRFYQLNDQAEAITQRQAADPVSAAGVTDGVRTLLLVPLRKEASLIGMITAARMEVRPFSEKEIALLQNFAAQAVIAMENARLITETREALEQQTATAEVLGVINSSAGDLGPVFNTLIETAARLCKSDVAHLMTRDGEGYRAVASFAHFPEFDSFIRSRLFTLGRETVAGRTVLESRVVHIVDLAADPEFDLPEAVNLGKLRSVLGVPLLHEGEAIGVITLSRQRVEPFTDHQIDLVRAFADQAVIAMENARLITETREALDHQTATAEVLGVINASPGDLTPVFEAILDKAMVSCAAAFGEMHTYDGAHFHAAALRGVPAAHAEFRRRGPTDASSGTITARVLEGERIIHVVDLKAEAPYRLGDAQRRSLVDLGGARTALAVAFRSDHALLGLLMVYRQEVRPFSEKHIALLENFAAQAVIAMENARLLDELRQRTDEVGELNRGLEARVAEQVDELGRVGRLKRFLAPQLAELIVSHGDEKILESHRREIVVVFCDLRGYTAFTETAEPEEVLDFLREYHGALGPLVSQYEGTLDQFSGDGIMVFFNDPVPCADPAERAVNMAMAMREAAGKLIVTWRRDGCELGFGAGIAQGYATLGQIGFSERSGYTAIGTVCNLAARLCAEAKDGQILISSRVARAVEAVARLEDLGNLELKGLRRPVAAFNVVQSTSSTEARPTLTVVAKGYQED